VYALRDLSLKVDKGEFLFLTGPSGAGKSTFLRLLLREELPSEGELKVAGRNLTDLGRSEVQAYRRSIGFVFQDFKLIPRFTVFQNVSFVMRVLGALPAVQQRKTFQVLKWVGLQHRMNAFPQELSGGEQQRVAVARALVGEPAILLADEPTGNLDSTTSEEIMRVFEDLASTGQTVIMVTHEPDIAAHARRVVVLRDGVISSDERKEKFISRTGGIIGH